MLNFDEPSLLAFAVGVAVIYRKLPMKRPHPCMCPSLIIWIFRVFAHYRTSAPPQTSATETAQEHSWLRSCLNLNPIQKHRVAANSAHARHFVIIIWHTRMCLWLCNNGGSWDAFVTKARRHWKISERHQSPFAPPWMPSEHVASTPCSTSQNGPCDGKNGFSD